MEALITKSNGKYQVELSDNREVNKTKGILIADGIDTARIGSEFVIHTYCGKRFTGSVFVSEIHGETEGCPHHRNGEISDEEKRWMGEMMQATGMIRRDCHTLD